MPQSPTPNMLLIQPSENGDDNVWDVLLTAVFALIDAHDHTTSKGVKVPVAGLNINGDLPFGTNSVTGLKAADFTPVTTAAVASYAGAFFVNSADNELYFRTIGGANVKFTNGAALNVAAFAGGIGGDYSAVGAHLDYVDADKRYRHWTQTNTWALMASGSLDLYESLTSTANRVRLQSPSGLAASYTVTFPATVPGSTQLVQMSSGGVLTATNTIAENLTLAVNKNVGVSGTGKYTHGSKKTVTSLFRDLAVTSTGSCSNNGGQPGVALAASTTIYYPLHGLNQDKRIVSVQFFLNATPGSAIVYTFALSGFVVSTFADGSDTLSSTSVSPTLTLAAPFSLAPADNGGYNVAAWIKIAVPGGVTPTITHMVITFDDV